MIQQARQNRSTTKPKKKRETNVDTGTSTKNEDYLPPLRVVEKSHHAPSITGTR
jgi:hypothetical protein